MLRFYSGRIANIPARAGVASVNALLAKSWNDSLIQKLKKENLKTDEQKKDEKKEEIK